MNPRERLKALRESRGLSLRTLADAAGCTKTHLHALEQGRSRMEGASYDLLCSIAAALGLSVNELMRTQ